LALIASLLAFAAYTARGRARENEQIAQQNEATAVIESQLRTTAEAQAIDQRNLALGEASRVLAVLSQQQLSRDPVQSLNLAIQALPSAEISRPYVAEAEFALTEAIKNSLERAYFDPFNGSSLTQVAIHDNNLAIAGQGLALTTTDLESPTFLGAHTATVSGIEWSSSGLLL